MEQKALSLYFSFFNEIGIISQLSRALMDARLPAGLSSSHFVVLNHLIRVEDGRTPLELARALQVAKTTMTHTLAGLQSHGLVEMRPNLKDGRSKCVWLTKKGRHLRDQTIIDLQPDLSKIIQQLPPEKVASLVSELAEIRKIMDANRNDTAD
ncbi:MAG: MarR family transcriptional regulator [Hyphomicrobiales bacterium]|nr:MarR family transcriptional regulator [Hyphomicrobiales bacterium]